MEKVTKVLVKSLIVNILLTLTPTLGCNSYLVTVGPLVTLVTFASTPKLSNVFCNLIAISLKEGYDAIKDILGEEIKVDLSEEIFSRFCVGK